MSSSVVVTPFRCGVRFERAPIIGVGRGGVVARGAPRVARRARDALNRSRTRKRRGGSRLVDPIGPRDDGVARSRARARPDNRGWRCRVTDSRGLRGLRGLRTWRREEVIRTIPLGGVTARLGGLAGGLLDGRGLAHDGLLGGDLLGRGGSLLGRGGSLLGRGGSLLGGRGGSLLEERVDLENSHLVLS